MKKILLSICFLSLYFASLAQFRVSENKRFILRDGKPFFWLGDTAWELFHRLNREQAEYYLKRRAEQGYTVIQSVVLAEFDGLHAPNPYGDVPLAFDDPTKPIEKYFQHVDYIIDKANQYGLVIGLLPTWGDKLFKAGWGKGPEIFTKDNAKIYGKWIGNRYKDRKNIVWILGGDRNPRNQTDIEVWRAMAAGIEEAIGGSENAMISFHPQPNEESSAEWFHTDEWLDFNMFQTGHCRDKPVYDYISRGYQKMPTKPVMDSEPIYEDHPVCFNAKEFGTSNSYDVRRYAYLDLFAGAFGHTYGCHDIWQFYSPYHEAVNNPHIYWQEAMELPAANQMKFVRQLLEARPLLDRIPDQSLVEENNLYVGERIQATRGNDYAFVYASTGKPFMVNLGKITGNHLNAYWFNPRNGEVKFLEKLDNKGKKRFSPPSSGYGHDWVLMLDDASKNYSVPK
ncbi:MAG: DUF4038 domain-containing protein [Cytophagales bacterium]|nr:MAG: DUF4038 domain-containing protein [Cytophagales bacterium]